MKHRRLMYLCRLAVFYISLQALLRLIMLLESWPLAAHSAGELIKTFALGAVYDAAVGADYCLPLALIMLLCPVKVLMSRLGRAVIAAVTFGMMLFSLFTAVSQYLFWDEFHTNFNFIAVDYLIYTTEVIKNITQSYNLWLIVPLLLLSSAVLTWWHMRRLSPIFAELRLPLRAVLLGTGLLLPGLLGCVFNDDWRRSVSPNNYNVEIAGNGAWAFVHAFNHNELDYAAFYAVQDETAALDRLRTLLREENSVYQNDNILRYVENNNSLSERRPNIIFITVESLSSSFMGAFGAEKSYTPHLDELAQQSYRFTNMLATGTRTVRGLEAVSLSVPPTPGQSILRRPQCSNLTTLGSVLTERGYKSDFLYGGYGYFDNMNEFFSSNGYAIKDRRQIPREEVFQETAWGVADEILFTQVLKSMDEHFAAGEPAFEMIMTTSNHRPYTFPEGRVPNEQGKREGAVAYTDWAIADFLRRSAEKPWFDNTVFVIIADHQADVAGKTALPIHKYRIPCMVYSPKLIRAQANDRLMSQIDIVPTLLGMLGVSYNSRFLGYDINRLPTGEERAFISTYQSLGYVKGDRLVVLEPGRRVNTFQIDDWMSSRYTRLENDENLTAAAIAWYEGASYLYKNGLLRRDAEPSGR